MPIFAENHGRIRFQLFVHGVALSFLLFATSPSRFASGRELAGTTSGNVGEILILGTGEGVHSDKLHVETLLRGGGTVVPKHRAWWSTGKDVETNAESPQRKVQQGVEEGKQEEEAKNSRHEAQKSHGVATHSESSDADKDGKARARSESLSSSNSGEGSRSTMSSSTISESMKSKSSSRSSGTSENSKSKSRSWIGEAVANFDGDSDVLPFLMNVDTSQHKQVTEEDTASALAEAEDVAVDDNPEHYEGDLTEQVVEEKKEDEKHDDVGEMIDHILDRLEDEKEDKGAGRFNETLEKQEATLEWVARVGKHHSLSDDDDELTSKEEKKDAESADETKREGGKNEKEKGVPSGRGVPLEDGRATEETTVQKELPWLGRILGVGGGASAAAVAAEKAKDLKKRNRTIINGQLSSNFHSEAEVKEMGEAQAKQAKEKEAREEAKEEARKEEKKKEERAMDQLPRLIDSNDNEYVISNPGKGSKMQLQEDLTLISDIVKVIVAAALGALVCGLLGQPLILGYLAAGMLVGPGGFRLIHELVQVETLAQFGVIFLLFALGVEFNMARMQGCQAVALGGGALQIVIAMLLGGLFSTVTTQGIFIGAFLSMSSTAVVLKCLMDSNTTHTEHGQIMLGTLILQDCALGLLLAVMPALAAKGSSAFSIGKSLLREVAVLCAFCALAWVVTKTLIPPFLRTLIRLSKHSSELYQLGCVGICLCVALLSEHLGLSLEVGAFVAGLMLSGGKFSERTLHQVEPLRNIFAALFLASIGMVMHPVFLWQHKDILLASLLVVFFGKACLIAVTVRIFGYSAATAASVGISLAQIGEFSFVLLARALALNLVTHKVYLLLMGTTALSLVLTPFAFKLVPYIVALDNTSKATSKHRNGRTVASSANVPVLVIGNHRDSSEATGTYKRKGLNHSGGSFGTLSAAPLINGSESNVPGSGMQDPFEDDEKKPPRVISPHGVAGPSVWGAGIGGSGTLASPPSPVPSILLPTISSLASASTTPTGVSSSRRLGHHNGIGVAATHSGSSFSTVPSFLTMSNSMNGRMSDPVTPSSLSPASVFDVDSGHELGQHKVMMRRPLGGQIPAGGKWKVSPEPHQNSHHQQQQPPPAQQQQQHVRQLHHQQQQQNHQHHQQQQQQHQQPPPQQQYPLSPHIQQHPSQHPHLQQNGDSVLFKR
eukprot:TRINITY_DN2193_c0_g2_i1.p1 TRINITY_DN2193_c0_g2~~TRINITY_DN2193_c0_g2_i1.p1  ORF type:complete len:1175 (-),score=225.62 TRINITY_DN2193_c0_g2_i1:1418-4942(-)